MFTTLLMTAVLAAAPEFNAEPLQRAFPDAAIQSMEASAVPPWLELVLADGRVVYATPDGRHLLVGSLIDLERRENLTERRQDRARRALLDASLPRDLFEFPAEEPLGEVLVVTDIDCPYCRRLHQQMADYTARGISVSYLMLPRAGLGSASHRKAVNAACSVSPEAALTRAMNGEELEAAACDNSIDEQFRLARKLQVTGTPAIILESGRMLAGYVPPSRLVEELQKQP